MKWLRVEGVNLYNFIYDTSDLSTIRGSGLLLLQAIQDIETKFENQLEPISTGASSGFFKIKDDADAEAVAEDVKEHLSEGNYRFATFVVDVVEDNATIAETDRFIHSKELALAKNRFQQMRSPSVFIPQLNEDNDLLACEENRLHPGTKDVKYPDDETVKLSQSVADRRDYGKVEKQKFYVNVIKKVVDEGEVANFSADYVNDFEKLTKDDGKGNLNKKMAVIYLDGNSFSNIQSEHCKTSDSLKSFDDYIQRERAIFLKSVVEEMKDADKGKHWKTSTGELQFETLLWGGDEMVFVVPAWKGWEFMLNFYEASKKWTFPQTDEGSRLTHCAGIVFCSHKAPIGRVRQLAEDLANDVKDGTDRRGNFFTYEALESFDHIGQDLDAYRKRRVATSLSGDGQTKVRQEAMSLSANALNDDTNFIEDFVSLKNELPRRRLYRLVRGLIGGVADDDLEDQIKDLIGELNDENQTKLFSVLAALNGPASNPPPPTEQLRINSTGWIHLNNLWDYIEKYD